MAEAPIARQSAFVTPQTQDAELVGLFRVLILTVTVALAIYITVLLLNGSDLLRLVAPFLILAGGPPALWFLGRGQPRKAFFCYMLLVWMSVCVQSGLRSGLLNPVLHVNTLLILMGGWLLGKRYAVALWAGCVAWAVLLATAATLGWYVPLPPTTPPLYTFAAVTVWTIGLLVMLMVLRANEQRVAAVHALNLELTQKYEELKQQREAVLRSEEKVRQIMAATPMPISVIQLDTAVFLDVNPAWERVFMRRRDEVLGVSLLGIGGWNDVARIEWLELIKRDGRVSQYETTFALTDGREKTFLLSSERFEYDGQLCIVTMLVDVSERKALEVELKQLNASLESRVQDRTEALSASNHELKRAMTHLRLTQEDLVQSEKLASLGRLVAGVAHELNTPIGNALTAASTIADGRRDIAQAVKDGQLRRNDLDEFLLRCGEGAELTRRSLERAVDLIQGFKQVAVDQASERRRSFDLAEMLQELLETLGPNLRRTTVRVLIDVPAGIAMDSYPGPLGQVVINLVMNAVIHGYGEDRSGEVRLWSETDAAGARVTLHCEDDGQGIQPEHLGRVFDPFFTTKLGQGGSGLGLSVSHRLVTQLMGGQISVASASAGSTRFTLTLPLTAPQPLA